jgi:hypothetical protein
MGDKGNVKKVSQQPIVQPKAATQPSGKSNSTNASDTFVAPKQASGAGAPAVAPPAPERGKTIYDEYVDRLRALSNKADNLYGEANVFAIALQLAPKALKTKPLQKHMPGALRAAFTNALFEGYIFRNDPKAHYEKFLPTSGISANDLRELEKQVEAFLANLA